MVFRMTEVERNMSFMQIGIKRGLPFFMGAAGGMGIFQKISKKRKTLRCIDLDKDMSYTD